MTIINPYLTFKGNCEDAFNFYRSVFGGEFSYVGRFADMPQQEGSALSEEDKKKIMHISLPISKETILMGSDTGGEWAPGHTVGNNITLSVSTNQKEEADRLYSELSEAGRATMPMSQTFWGSYFGMCTDKYDINWMISFDEGENKGKEWH